MGKGDVIGEGYGEGEKRGVERGRRGGWIREKGGGDGETRVVLQQLAPPHP